jgi:hypothetical protein
MVKVELTMAEVQIAAMVGCQRVIEKLKAKEGYSVSGENPDTFFERYIPGAIAEAALAKHFNIYWHKGEKGEPDVGDVDCRCTPYPNGHLAMHKHDKDDRKYYLLTGCNGKYVIRGWIWGRDAKKDKYLKVMQEGRTAQYFIPQADLNPVDSVESFKPDTEKHWLDD